MEQMTARDYQKRFGNKTTIKKSGKPSKFKNIKVRTKAGKFDSKRELKEYERLLALKKIGVVKSIERQVRFLLLDTARSQTTTYRKRFYIADFVVVYDDGRKEIIDVKGFRTEMYRIKKHLFFIKYGVEIIEK